MGRRISIDKVPTAENVVPAVIQVLLFYTRAGFAQQDDRLLLL